jgi:hypothetical protein
VLAAKEVAHLVKQDARQRMGAAPVEVGLLIAWSSHVCKRALRSNPRKSFAPPRGRVVNGAHGESDGAMRFGEVRLHFFIEEAEIEGQIFAAFAGMFQLELGN